MYDTGRTGIGTGDLADGCAYAESVGGYVINPLTR
jgi:hypothetical protein